MLPTGSLSGTGESNKELSGITRETTEDRTVKSLRDPTLSLTQAFNSLGRTIGEEVELQIAQNRPPRYKVIMDNFE